MLAEHETLLEVLGEKTEACDALETSLRAATERAERCDATDAPVFERDGFETVRRRGWRDAYAATLTHAAFAEGRVELEPADD